MQDTLPGWGRHRRLRARAATSSASRRPPLGDAPLLRCALCTLLRQIPTGRLGTDKQHLVPACVLACMKVAVSPVLTLRCKVWEEGAGLLMGLWCVQAQMQDANLMKRQRTAPDQQYFEVSLPPPPAAAAPVAAHAAAPAATPCRQSMTTGMRTSRSEPSRPAPCPQESIVCLRAAASLALCTQCTG